MKLTTEQFIQKAREVHGDKYDYSRVVYTSVHSKIKIICPEHGEFEQRPNNHVSNKRGCRKCQYQQFSIHHSKTAEDFITKARFIHGDKYDYSLVEYLNNRTDVTIICPKHGPFKQWPSNHTHRTMKQGCPVCKESKGELLIAGWLADHGVEYQRGKRIQEFNPRKPFDFYLPAQDLYIEYDGEFHFRNGYDNYYAEKQRERDQKRNEWCQSHNVNLLVITYTEDVVSALSNAIKLG